MSSPMHLYVFVIPYKPIAGLIPPMSKGEATWPVSSVSLITGERDAVADRRRPHHPGRGADRKMDRGDRKESHDDLHHPRPRRPLLRPEPDPQRVPGGQGRHRGSRGPRSPGPAEPGLPAVWTTTFPGQIPAHLTVPGTLDGEAPGRTRR